MKKTILILFLLLAKLTFAQWTNLTSGTTNWLRAVYFTTTDTGYVVGYGGIILKTTDGMNWVSQTSTTTNNLFGVFFVTSSTGWACGDGAILKTINGGLTGCTSNFLSSLFS